MLLLDSALQQFRCGIRIGDTGLRIDEGIATRVAPAHSWNRRRLGIQCEGERDSVAKLAAIRESLWRHNTTALRCDT